MSNFVEALHHAKGASKASLMSLWTSFLSSKNYKNNNKWKHEWTGISLLQNKATICTKLQNTALNSFITLCKFLIFAVL